MAKVDTKYGEMEDGDLAKVEYPNQFGAVIREYYLDGELVHRSVVTRLTGVQADAVAQSFSAR